jgi:hypothetical protein
MEFSFSSNANEVTDFGRNAPKGMSTDLRPRRRHPVYPFGVRFVSSCLERMEFYFYDL